MATDTEIAAVVRQELLAILAAGDPYTGIPLVDPDTNLLAPPILDAIRGPLEEATTELEADLSTLSETVGTQGTDVASLKTLTTSGRLSEAQQIATFVPIAVGRSDAADMPNGTPAAMSVTGQALTTFGNAPMVVTSGAISHTWNGVSGSSAGYLAVQTDGPVTRIGAMIRAFADTYSTFDLIIPTSSDWSNNNYTDAKIHFVLRSPLRTGGWSLGHWDGSSDTFYAGGSGVVGAWDDGSWRLVEIVHDVSTSSVTITLPDGQIVTVTNAAFSTPLHHQGVWELYETTGSAEVNPVQIGAFWVDTAEAASTPTVTAQRVARALAGVPKAPGHKIHAPTTQLSAATTTSAATIDTANFFAQVVVGPTGIVLAQASAFYEFTADDTLFWRISITGVGDGTVRAAHRGKNGETVLVSQLMEYTGLTPGATVIVKLKHYSATNATATLLAGGSGASMRPPATLLVTSK